jgi:hypothetical protein
MTKKPTNIAASVHARLLQISKERIEDFNLTIQRYAMERFLYRLGKSDHRNRLILKGAMLFTLWGGPVYRPTRDLDFSGTKVIDIPEILALFRYICEIGVEDDGLVFDGESLSAEPIRDDTEHGGIRTRFSATLGPARIRMQIDVGFGDAIEPPPESVEYPTLLDFPAPGILAYPKEAAVAEKIHAWVDIGDRNSRLKDLYDLHEMLNCFRFEGDRITRSIAATFKQRNMNIDAEMPAALTPRFFRDSIRRDHWLSYLSRNHLPDALADLAVVGELLMSFINPVWSSMAEGSEFKLVWEPGGPWMETRIAG